MLTTPLARACIAAAVLLLTARPSHAQLSVGHVKSLFIERFTRFIEWPPASLPPGKPFVVCIAGGGQTGDDLARVAPSRRFKDRQTVVRRLRLGDDPAACHVLYLGPGESPRLAQILEAVAGKDILTVSDTPGFADRGVIINLYQEGRFMRFEINAPAVKRGRLVFSSQLLRLGRLVGEPPRTP